MGSVEATAADSLRVRVEIGATSESSNEVFYEQSYTDTTFLGRRLVGTPEGHAAGVAVLELNGLRQNARWAYRLRPELTIGDVLTRAAGSATVRFTPNREWRLSFDPRVDVSRDRRFSIDRRQQLLAAMASARRLWNAGANVLTLRAGGEALGVMGSTDPYLLAHRIGRASLGWEHDGFPGLGWSLRYGLDGRAFPDSSERAHLEHSAEASIREDFLGGHSLTFDAGASRRLVLNRVVGTRDRFVNVRSGVAASIHTGERTTLRVALATELLRFDQPDSSVDFNYSVTDAELELKRDLVPALALAIVPRLQVLGAAWAPAERYREGSLAIELEWQRATSWWLIEPAYGCRAYEVSEGGDSLDPDALHSTYRYLELQVLADQSLPTRLRLRLTLDVRDERHDDPSQDSRSLYFSLDLRRLF